MTAIKCLEDGPVIIKLEKAVNIDGSEKDMIALCRCGASVRKPYCDGNHKMVGFEAGEVIVIDEDV